MCYYPFWMNNPKFKKNKKNQGQIPYCRDIRLGEVAIGCGRCKQCLEQRANSWKVRLWEDIKVHKNGKFVTFTFSDEYLKKLSLDINPNLEGYERDNAIAVLAVKRFLKRWKDTYGERLRHWLVTELGGTATERIHLHGIIWTDKPKSEVRARWMYGNMGWEIKDHSGKRTEWEMEQNYVNGATINYIVKYCSKQDPVHKFYKSKILTSNGIGRAYTETASAKENAFNENKPTETRNYYRTETGHKIALPMYYRNKIYSDREKETLWLNQLDKQERWVWGTKIDVSKTYKYYNLALEDAQRKNIQLGYGKPEKEWSAKEYEKQLRNLNWLKLDERLNAKENKEVREPESIRGKLNNSDGQNLWPETQ